MSQSAALTSDRPVLKIAPLLFCSGACALLYQVVWVREFRLIFGASTAASAAVLAMFMGGLGAGGLLLGQRVDKRRDPLMFYANLELGVSVLAAISPLAVDVIRRIYAALGGTFTLGAGAGTVIRLLLAAIVLVPPTFLMGGTLPAAARAAETRDDTERRSIGLLYGVNTLGAVIGSALSTFVLLEVFGNRILLWIGCLLNALLGVLARGIARSMPDTIEHVEKANVEEPAEAAANEVSEEGAVAKEESTPEDKPAKIAPKSDESETPARFVLAAAAIVGFSFLLMELVFYRMLGPVLGGSSYTFGLILAMALLGVGIGGAAYPVIFARRPATISAFAVTCVLEALGFALPYALGDRIALLALGLRSFGHLGFAALCAGWFFVALVVVLPAAIVSGLQFPLLIALLGKAQKDAGRHVGLAYAWNTAGAIVGSLAGGFGFLPWLTAPGVWRLSAVLLVGLAVGALVLSARFEKKKGALVLPALAIVVTLALVRTEGPTAVSRHSPIGAGRSDGVLNDASINSVRDWMNQTRRAIVWEADGVESSVALHGLAGYSFVVNGKADGHVRVDAGTQVIGGLIGGLVHPAPKNALVVGLGTGSTAGWLGAIPSMERVDVIELEPAILHVARSCAAVNHNALDNPKLHVFIGDAREVLTTTNQRYDIIFSEPSNPYRAGIASLFTADFYQSAVRRLAPKGIFLQWLQAYEVDAPTVESVYATLGSVFPNVETWSTESGDLILAATMEPVSYDVAALRARIMEEPYATALQSIWRVSDLEGVFAHYVSNGKLTRTIAEKQADAINTDDRNLLEFSFARMVGRHAAEVKNEMMRASAALHIDLPEQVTGVVDKARIDEERAMIAIFDHLSPTTPMTAPDASARMASLEAYMAGSMPRAVVAWRKQQRAPQTPSEIESMAHALSVIGDSEALALIAKLEPYKPAEAAALTAMYHLQKGALAEATDAAVKALELRRTDPWSSAAVFDELLNVAPNIALKDKVLGRRLYDAGSQSFAVQLNEEQRRRFLMQLASRVDFVHLCVDAVSSYEPHVPFRSAFLFKRLDCYKANHHPLRGRAAKDLDEYLSNAPQHFMQGEFDDEPAEDNAPQAPPNL